MGRQDSRSSNTPDVTGFFRQGLKRHRSDELAWHFRVRDDEDRVSRFDQLAGEIGRLVSGDGAANAKDDQSS